MTDTPAEGTSFINYTLCRKLTGPISYGEPFCWFVFKRRVFLKFLAFTTYRKSRSEVCTIIVANDRRQRFDAKVRFKTAFLKFGRIYVQFALRKPSVYVRELPVELQRHSKREESQSTV